MRCSLILCDSAFYPIQSIIHRCSPLCRIYYPATCLHQKFAPRVSVFVLDEIRIHRIRDKLKRPICRYALPPNIYYLGRYFDERDLYVIRTNPSFFTFLSLFYPYLLVLTYIYIYIYFRFVHPQISTFQLFAYFKYPIFPLR